MTIWVDAQLSPALARWLASRFAMDVRHIRELNLVEASDPSIFRAARSAEAIVLTKDRDFVAFSAKRVPLK